MFANTLYNMRKKLAESLLKITRKQYCPSQVIQFKQIIVRFALNSRGKPLQEFLFQGSTTLFL